MATVPFEITPEIRNLHEYIAQEGDKGWERAWVSKVTPWNVGRVQPPFEELVTSGEIPFPRSGKALVPGCGKGHDAIFIASFLGLETTGADYAPTAVELANETLKNHPSPPPNVKFEQQDFFAISVSAEYDLVYDYTFFQALPPTQRGSWGNQMNKIIKKGGYLITFVFPTTAKKDVGPPYGIDEDSHLQVLGDGWDKVLDRIPTNSMESHVGNDRLIVWRKK